MQHSNTCKEREREREKERRENHGLYVLAVTERYPVSIQMGETTLPPRFAWPEEDALTEENIRKWFDSVVAGSPKIHKKSEPVPEDNSGPVKVIVASQFEELVTKSGKNVLVEFYAPWCGHCKALAGTYEDVGKRYAGVDNVVIAKMDATENYVDPAYNIQGFPTILLFKPDGTNVSFDKERAVEGFLDFIEEQTGIKANSAAAHDEL
jgi:protein disulfide-isomerase A1